MKTDDLKVGAWYLTEFGHRAVRVIDIVKYDPSLGECNVDSLDPMKLNRGICLAENGPKVSLDAFDAPFIPTTSQSVR